MRPLVAKTCSLKSDVAEPVMCLVLYAGFLRDRLGSYDVAFYLAGIPPLIGGAMLCLIPWVEAQEEEEGEAAGARSLREDAGEQERHTGGGEGQRARVRHLRALTADRLD